MATTKEARADRLNDWAAKHRAAAAALHKRNEPYTSDYAFNTQPGHIPERERVHARQALMWKHTKAADKMEARARRLRHVRVPGDAEAKRREKREEVLQWLTVGMRVNSVVFGKGVVSRIHKKTIKFHQDTATAQTRSINVPIHFLRQA